MWILWCQFVLRTGRELEWARLFSSPKISSPEQSDNCFPKRRNNNTELISITCLYASLKSNFTFARTFAFAALPIPCENDNQNTRSPDLFHSPAALAHQKCISLSSRALRTFTWRFVFTLSLFFPMILFSDRFFSFACLLICFVFFLFADIYTFRMCNEWCLAWN